MIGGAVLVVAGVGVSSWGLRAATAGQRPRDLVGALAAGLGVLLGATGAAAMFVPRLFD